MVDPSDNELESPKQVVWGTTYETWLIGTSLKRRLGPLWEINNYL